ncbi:hypothetical protein MSAN_02346700 [Mycena sanguinolenta]|uniref:C2H2-type domain-containing protein n=1 Tax=Mycena sanguinolenta TaxID=230812 RepID=A0A8H6X7E1_9AGAR|nr:hypothetical protein MSAN_02346700 [Mycena sanguinolenta]
MFSGDPRSLVHDEESYLANRRRLEGMQKIIDDAKAVNEQGKRNYDQLTNELQRKIQEGEDARVLLAALQHSRPRLTYDSIPEGSASFFVNAPTQLSPTPSARIEEVQSDRHPNAQQFSSSSQTQALPSGFQHQQFWPKQTPGAGPSAPFRGQPQPHTSQSNLGQQTHQRQSSTASSHYRSSPTPSYTPQNANQTAPSQLNSAQPAQHRPSPTSHPQQATSQLNSNLGQPMQQRPSQAPSYPQQNIGQSQVQPMWPQPPATVNPQQLQLHSSLSGRRASQPKEQSMVPPPRTDDSRRPSAPPISNAQTGATSQRISQPREQTIAAPPRTDGSQRQPSTPPIQNAQGRPSVPPAAVARPNSGSAQSQAQPMPSGSRPPAAGVQSNPLLQPNPLFQLDPSRKSTTPSAVPTPAPVTATAPASTPSYGISPFAHNPAPKPQPNIGAQQPVVSNQPAIPTPRSVPPIASASVTKKPPPAEPGNVNDQHLNIFLNLINTWQKASPPQAYMDIPHATIRIKKLPSGTIHFFGPDSRTRQQVRLSSVEAFNRLRFQGTAAIYVSPVGVNELLQAPVSEKVKATHKQFSGVEAKDAPEATFPTPLVGAQTQALPNGGAPLVPTPKDADKRFLAHDILRALGKVPADDDRVRYAKRRALEAPVQKQEPLVLQRISSNEPSAKSTPSESGSSPPPPPSPPPAAAMSVPQRMPLFLQSPVKPSLSVSARPRPRSTLPEIYVLMPPAPYAKRDAEKLRAQRKQLEMVTEDAPMDDAVMLEDVAVSDDVAVPEDVAMPEVPEESSEPEPDMLELKRRRALGMYQNTENEEEVAAMLEACTRLREVQCEWFSCGAILNSVENLVAHLHEVHAQDQDLPTCMWDGICGETFPSSTQLALHAETHVLETILCPYEDCGQFFSSPRELVAHNSLGHAEQNDDEPVRPRALLPSSRLSAPDEASLVTPPVLERIPTWEVPYLAQGCISPSVQMPDISSERHAALGPWVLANICAPTTKLRARRYNAALPLKYQPDYEFAGVSCKHYSFLPSQSARVRDVAELDSHQLTEMLRTGEFVLWPPEEQFQLKDEVEEGSTASTVVEKVPGSAGVLEKTLDVNEERAGNRQSSIEAEIVPYQNVGEKTDEEMMVEDMLQEREADQ